MTAPPDLSVVIAAHNEQAVIGTTLRTLLAGEEPGRIDVTVVANGCTDATAEVARSVPGVRVVELAEPGKPGALNAGDQVAIGFPRVYLDGDIPISAANLRTVAEGLRTHLAAVPRRELDLTGRPLLVRAYYAIHSRLPVFTTGLFGRGVIAVSERGRARFDRFPDVIADDLFLDSQFTSAEKCVVPQVASTVATPLRTRDLVRRLTRVRAGNAALRSGTDPESGAAQPSTKVDPESGAATPAAGADPEPGAGAPPRPAARLSWLTDVVLPRPWLAPAAACYVAITVLAALRARRRSHAQAWGRDESSRVG